MTRQPFSPVKFGRYHLVERVAKGGMAEIFLARVTGALGFEKELIIKRILPSLARDPEFVRMLGTEARLVCNLQHPNIVQVHELDQVDGVYYIAMEHVEGLDAHVLWRTLARRGQRLPVQLALYVVSELLKGLAFAHQAVGPDGRPLGVVHRDVSPSNILISTLGEVKIGDFGIARVGQESRSRAGVLKGKYGYMTPEQLAGLPVDHRSDIFSAGTVLAELLTGKRLFRGRNDFETMRQVLNVRLHVLDADRTLAPALMQVVRRALAREPADRYRSADAFRDAILAHQRELSGPAGGPVNAKTLAAFIAQHVAPHLEGVVAPATAPGDRPPPAPREILRVEAVIEGEEGGTVELELELEGQGADRDQILTARLEPPQWLAADTQLDLPPPAPATDQVPSRSEEAALMEFSPPLAEGSRREDSLLIEVAPPRREDSLLIELPTPQGAGGPPPGRPPPSPPRALELRESGEYVDLGLEGGARGSLRAVSLARVLFRYMLGGAAGLLVLEGPRATARLAGELAWVEALAGELGLPVARRPARATCQLHLQGGGPALLAADRTEPLLAAHLLQMKKLGREELAAAVRAFPAFRPITALLASDRVAPLEMSRYVNSFVQWSLLDAFSWREGGYTFYPGRGKPADAFLTGLNMMQLIATGIASMEEAALDHHLGRWRGRRIQLNPTPAVEIRQLRNDPLLSALCQRVATATPLGAALDQSLELDEPRRVKQGFFFLIECELVELL